MTQPEIPVLTTTGECLDWFLDVGEATFENVDAAIGRVGRNNAPALLMDLYDHQLLTAAAASRLVAYAWSGAEFPQSCLDDDCWRALFALAGYTDDGRPASRPSGPLTLFRGAPEGWRHGWAWTADRVVAERFAVNRDIGRPPGRSPATVWTATVEPWRCYAHIHKSSRGEDEYVIDTKGLTITQVGFAAISEKVAQHLRNVTVRTATGTATKPKHRKSS